ncbi:helix-turn-helix transcriptional regulator [Burkholderia pseudomallei]|uniref:helix-turn-helix transcriptional regulator n=1 Tax=Burkholderia pseudomallei TaxID=28450 RepID=UPI001E36AD12|nr:AlpA family phage regulatory protein [Burkholderia pseudomallei]
MSDLYESSRLGCPERPLRFAEVRARIGVSKTEIYRRIAAGTFPAGVRLGARAVAWRICRRCLDSCSQVDFDRISRAS